MRIVIMLSVFDLVVQTGAVLDYSKWANMTDPDDEEEDPLKDGKPTLFRDPVLYLRELAASRIKVNDYVEAMRVIEEAKRVSGGKHAIHECLEEMAESVLVAISRGGKKYRNSTIAWRTTGREEAVQRKAREAETTAVCEERYAWSQTSKSVIIDVFVPATTKGKDVGITYDDESVSLKVSGKEIFGGKWEHCVWYPVDVEDYDWEVRTRNGRRSVRLIVQKLDAPIDWSCVLKGDQCNATRTLVDLIAVADSLPMVATVTAGSGLTIAVLSLRSRAWKGRELPLLCA
eukprot:gnl/TRDRNA2_/TRDRNA2_88553_c0_seq1.p1 gnl/TRDRNA2_/TRDRNA2_88553_c0~~gnl/TRDRNA2_/TRDRNA2_88553_c0_seq1.p1  ORF type:complete len:288 (+),score=38.98 gnl/TRDRNA2_/TRDRNA2_88553_c0_seq1:146-1009(+)